MIADFLNDGTRKIFEGEVTANFPPDIQQTARRKLRMLAAAININDLRQPPGNRLEKLSGDRDEQCSIRINDQWRICFVWKNDNAYRVEISKHYEK